MMTHDEFRAYVLEKEAKRGGISIEQAAINFDRHKVILPCACDEPCCKGWGVVHNDPESIAQQIEDYAPGTGNLAVR